MLSRPLVIALNMMDQAVGAYMDWVQLTTFLLFLTFYIP